MKVVLTGASGLLGPALVSSWREDGHEVLRLVRRPPAAPDEARWDPAGGTVDPGALRDAEVVVHLAGVGIGDQPWTPSHRRAVMDSRVEGTSTIARAVADAGVPHLLSMSGTGYYGNPGDDQLHEGSTAGDTYVAEVVKAWESHTAPAAEGGSRVAMLRTGVVVSGTGGAYGRRLLPLFRLGLGGRLGSGRQWLSWVALADYVRAVRFIGEHPELRGPVNVTSPVPLTNADMTAAMGRVLHRPTVLAAPAFGLRLVFKEFGDDLLGGQRVLPRQLLDAGFVFREPEFEAALRSELAHSRSTS